MPSSDLPSSLTVNATPPQSTATKPSAPSTSSNSTASNANAKATQTSPNSSSAAKTEGASQAKGQSRSATQQDTSGDFTQMLDELMNGGSPQVVLQALQTALSEEDSKDTTPDTGTTPGVRTTPDANAVAFDPQLLMLAAGGMQLGKSLTTQAQSQGASAIDTNAQRSAQSSLLDLALMGAGASARTGTSTTDAGDKAADSLLAATTSDANGSAQPSQDAAQNGKPADALVPTLTAPQTDRAGELREHQQIHARVGTPPWTDELAGKLTLMVGRAVQSASLHLSPESLGPLEVRISVQNDQTSVWFGAAHAETRTALEQALPRLRELLAGQGLNLSDAGVSHQAPRDRSRSYAANGEGLTEEREVAISSVGVRGMVDAYA